MHCPARKALTMDMSLSSLQVTGISSSIYHITHDLWDLLSIRLNITMEHAVHPIEPLKDFIILILYIFQGYSRSRNPHKDLPVEKPGIMFTSCWNKCQLFVVLFIAANLYICGGFHWPVRKLEKDILFLEGHVMMVQWGMALHWRRAGLDR